MQIPYAFKFAIHSMLREKWINLLSILTIGAGLLVISLALFSVYSIDSFTRKLPEKFSMILYLDDSLPKDKVEQLMNSLKTKSIVTSAKYISKENAIKELKTMFKNSNYIFEGLEENPLPDSIEIKLKKEAVGPEKVKKLAEEITKLKGVNEVDYGEKLLAALYTIRSGLTTIGVVLVTVLLAGIIFVCYSSVKILFYRRNEEIETFKLLGATRWFIRIPFFIEGAVIGTGGGIMSLISVFTFYYMFLMKLSLETPIFQTIFFPSHLFLILPLVGLFLGVTGAAIALGRLKY
jgi:cell division transport system permease protein